MSSNSGYRIWLGSVASMSRRSEPLADEVFGECRRFRIVEHAIDLPMQHVRLAELMLLGQRHQFFIGHRAPEEIGKPIGQGEIIERPAEDVRSRRLRRPPSGGSALS